MSNAAILSFDERDAARARVVRGPELSVPSAGQPSAGLGTVSATALRDFDPSGTGSVDSLLPEYSRGAKKSVSVIARLAGRLNASQTSEEEERKCFQERADLMRIKFSRPLTDKEQKRLAYVRWTLDRIEDARIGPTLDRLEIAVNQYETFLDEIKQLKKDLDLQSRAKR